MAGSVRYGATVSARDGMFAMDRVPVTKTWYNLRKLKKRSCMGSERKTCGVLRRMRKRQRIRFPDSRQGEVVSGNQRREIASDKTYLRVRSSRPSWKTQQVLCCKSMQVNVLFEFHKVSCSIRQAHRNFGRCEFRLSGCVIVSDHANLHRKILSNTAVAFQVQHHSPSVKVGNPNN
jgi:hypothetical protein